MLAPQVDASTANLIPNPAERTDDIQTLPVETVSASPLTSFSSRTHLWPSNEKPGSLFLAELGSLVEQINSVPGLLARENGSPTISIRGSALADRTLSLLQGMPLNMADGLGAPSLFIPQETIDSVRIFKGPASVFYGSAAMAGALDYRMRQFSRPALRLSLADDSGVPGSRSAFLALPLRSRSNGSAGQHAGREADQTPSQQVDRPTDRTPDRATDRRAEQDGLSPNPSGSAIVKAQLTAFHEYKPGRFAYQSLTGAADGRRDRNGRETARATGRLEISQGPWSFASHSLVARSQGESPGSLTLPNPSSFELEGALFGFELGRVVELSGERLIGSSLELNLRVFTLGMDGLYDRGLSFESRSRSRKTAISVDAQTEHWGFARLRTFFDLNFDDLEASWSSNGKMSERSRSIGQNLTLDLSPDVSAQVALRHEIGDGVGPKRFFPAVGLFLQSTNGRSWITASDGHRTPSLSDRYADVSYFKGNPDLKPEQSTSIEIGVAQGPDATQLQRPSLLNQGPSWTAVIFGTNYMNLVESRPWSSGAGSSPSVTSTLVNSGSARAFGAEFSLFYLFPIRGANWSVDASYNLLKTANETTGESLILAPQHQGQLTLSRQWDSWRISLRQTLWSEFYDRVPTSGELRTLPGWNTLDFLLEAQIGAAPGAAPGAARDFAPHTRNSIDQTRGSIERSPSESSSSSTWLIRAGILNVFDSPRELTIGYPEPQRRFFLSAQNNF